MKRILKIIGVICFGIASIAGFQEAINTKSSNDIIALIFCISITAWLSYSLYKDKKGQKTSNSILENDIDNVKDNKSHTIMENNEINITDIPNGTRHGSIYKTTDGIIVDDNDNDSIIIYRPLNRYMSIDDVICIDNQDLPHLKQDSIILKKGEFCCYIGDCNTYDQKKVTTGYAGKSSGYSVRITKGITYRGGISKGVPIQEVQTTENYGTLYLTNKRLIYKSTGKDSFDKSLDKISSIDEITNGIVVQIGSKIYTIVLESHTLFMMVLGLVKNKEFGTELPEVFTNKNVHYTCDPYVLNISKQNESKQPLNYSKIKQIMNFKTLKTIIALIVIVFIVGIFMEEPKTIEQQLESFQFNSEDIKGTKEILNKLDVTLEKINQSKVVWSNFDYLKKKGVTKQFECEGNSKGSRCKYRIFTDNNNKIISIGYDRYGQAWSYQECYEPDKGVTDSIKPSEKLEN